MGYAAATGFLISALWAYGQASVPGDAWQFPVAPNELGRLTAGALLLYLGGVFWTLGYDTIYALQDIEDDAMVGVKSSARRLGPNLRRGVGVFYLLTVILTVLAGLTAGLDPIFYIALLPWAAHLVRQVRDVRPDDPALALRLFRSNRDAGLILLVAIILGSVQFPL